MKMLFVFLFAFLQAPDKWTVTEIHPHLSRYHNSITVMKKDSTLIIQFDFPTNRGAFPAKGDKIEFIQGRKAFVDSVQSFDVINIIKPQQ